MDKLKYCEKHETYIQDEEDMGCIGKVKKKTKLFQKKGTERDGFVKLVMLEKFQRKLKSVEAQKGYFVGQDSYRAGREILQEKYGTAHEGVVNPINGERYDKKRWEAQVRQAYKIVSCSSREGVYEADNLRKTFVKMHEGELKPIYYCKELHDENESRNFTGEYTRKVWKWNLVKRSTEKKYKTPFNMEIAIENLEGRRGGRRGGVCESSTKYIKVKY